MNETTALQNLYLELRLDKWWEELLGQAPSPEFDFRKAEASLPRTELTAAKAIRQRFENRLSYVPTENRWYLWDGKVHAPCDGDGVAMKAAKFYYKAMRDALEHVKGQYDVLARHVASSGSATAKEDAAKIRAQYDKGEISKHKWFRDRIATEAGLKAVVRLMKTELDVSADHFADDRRWFVIRDGVYDMEAVRRDRRFNLLPHDPARAVFRFWDISEDTGADFPALRNFLNGSMADPGQARFYSKAVAYACMGAPTQTKVIVSLQGARNSGKSMLNRAMQRLGRDFFTEPNPSAIVAGGRNSDHARHSMRNARYIGFTEVTDRLDRAFVLKYTGGDEIQSEQKYVNGVSWRPQGIIFMASNYGMDVDRSDDAMFSRLYPIEFPHSFEANHPDPRFREDRELENKIVAEASGFLEWMKASYLALLKEGHDRTDSMEALRRAEAAEDDYSINRYIQDRIESGYFTENTEAKLGECAKVTATFLDYQGWCEAFQVPKHSRLPRGRFSKEMQKIYPARPYAKATRFEGLTAPSQLVSR
jgi:phage/plasmid-associated DNA primase